MRRHRARSAEDELPVIVALIAILAVIVFSCLGMMAPVLWGAFVSGSGQRLSEQSCSQETRCPDDARFQAFPAPPKAQFDPLMPHL